MIKVFIDNHTMQSMLSGLVDQVKTKIDFNLNYLKKRCKEKYGIEKINGVEHKDGNIVIYKDQIGCMLNYEVRFPMSVLITTKKNMVRTPSQNNGIPPELDEMPEEFDDLLEELDDIPPELDLDDLEEVNNIPLERDDLELEHDVIDEFIENPQEGMYKKKM